MLLCLTSKTNCNLITKNFQHIYYNYTYKNKGFGKINSVIQYFKQHSVLTDGYFDK